MERQTVFRNVMLVFFGLVGILCVCMVLFGDKKKVQTQQASAKLGINDSKAIESYLQGKWSWEKHSGSVNDTRRYRFEIIGNKLKIWETINNMEDKFDMNHEPNVHEFSLGEPTRDVDGYQCRYLQFDEGNVSLTYRAISPIWFVADDHWDTPVIRCGSGLPSWSRGWE